VALMAAAGTLAVGAAVVAALCLGSGCSSLGYYGQAVGGHLDILQRSRPVADWLAEAETPARLRERLQLSQELRDFAVRELRLPDNTSYRRYADLGRPAVVWNVVAAPELSLQLKTWCFPVLGCVGYRGYFNRDDATATAAELRAQGWEVYVYGVPAYSTLGWSNWIGGDPLLNTFLPWPEGELARLLFHELAHQVAYADDDTTFNESFATAVERLGGQRWLAQPGREAAAREYAELDRRRADWRELTLRHRQRLQALYASAASDDDKRRGKVELRQRLLDARLPEGSTVVIDSRPLPLDDPAAMAAEHGPLVLGDDGVLVRWIPSAPDAALRPLDAYLAERLDLALGALTAARAESEHP
jgi:predicted aminopeptidase